MIRGFFRLVGLLLLACGFIFMVYDGARFVADNTLRFTRLGQFWNDVHQSSQQALRTSMESAATMPTRNVNLTNELDHFVARKVKSGRYENASEVVRAGLRTLEREEQQYKAKLAALRAAIDQGDASGIARGNVFGRVRKAIKLPLSR